MQERATSFVPSKNGYAVVVVRSTKRQPVLALATDLDDFRRAPVDRYVAGDGWIAFYRPTFSGVVVWGRLCAQTVQQIAGFVTVRFNPPARPHPSVVDLRLVEVVDPDLLDERTRLIVEFTRAPELATRIAIIHPGGLVGALFLGIAKLAPSALHEAFFEAPEPAFAWLDRADQLPLLAELDQHRVAVSGVTPLVRNLRALLDEKRRLPLSQASRSLAVSTRSLQRGLADAGTSYQRELALATVRIAQRLLLDPAASVTEVAFEVGCSSPEHLTKLFRRVIDETPTAWRRRQLDG